MSKTYQILQGCYGEIHPDTIVLPDNVSLITGGPNDIGSCLHEGHQHYLLCMNKEFFELHKQEFDVPYGQIYENFPDIVFYSICDVKFIDNPPLIEVEEFNKMFSFNDYYITQYLKNGLLLSMCKINKISSESQVEIQYIYNRYLDGSNIFNMGIKNTDLSTLCYSWRDPIYICKNNPIALLYWKQLTYNTLKYFNVPCENPGIDVDVAYKELQKIELSEQEFLDESKFEHINNLMQFKELC